MTTVNVPPGVLLVELIVREIGLGLPAAGNTRAEGAKLQFAPVGRPLHEKLTMPWKFCGALT